MKTIGFLASHKENERRRAITLDDAASLSDKGQIFFERGYGEEIGFTDEDIIKIGANVATREEILANCEVICDPKIGDAEYLERLRGQTIFGWVHATQNRDITQKLIDNSLTAFAWEKMFEADGKHVFYRNNEIAGAAAVYHSMLMAGRSYEGCKVAVIGNGNTARGAMAALKRLGADISIYGRNDERALRDEIGRYDAIVNCILWDVTRSDHIIYRDDLQRMKRNAIIVDVSCDRNGGIETSVPTTIDQPVYAVDGILHYAVDHTPSLLYKDATDAISHEVCKYIIDVANDGGGNAVLQAAKVTESGRILDQEIIDYQGR